MLRVPQLAPVVLAMLAAGASPAPAAPNVYLQWNDCPPDGQSVRSFACDTNSGAELLVGSFVLDEPLTLVNAMESTILVVFPEAAIPSWWTPGGCRETNMLQLVTSPAIGPFTCVNPWPASSAGGVIWDTPNPGTGWARIRTAQAVPPGDEMTLEQDVTYNAFRIAITHAKTTGAGACGGCDIPAGMMIQRIRLSFSGSTAALDLSVPHESRDETTHFADWQCDGQPEWEWDRPALIGYTYDSSCTVPTRRSTWGSIKQLYR